MLVADDKGRLRHQKDSPVLRIQSCITCGGTTPLINAGGIYFCKDHARQFGHKSRRSKKS